MKYMENENLDYWGYMHGRKRTEFEEKPFLTLKEIFELKPGTIVRGSVDTNDNIKIKIHNAYDLLVIKKDGSTEYLTEIYTLRAISKMKFYIK